MILANAKSKVTAVAACVLLGMTGAVVAPVANAANCVGETRDGESTWQPIGPGNGMKELETVYVSSCDARILHDTIKENDKNTFEKALEKAVGSRHPLFKIAFKVADIANPAIESSIVRDASNDFSSGAVLTLENGTIVGGKAQ